MGPCCVGVENLPIGACLHVQQVRADCAAKSVTNWVLQLLCPHCAYLAKARRNVESN